jgi:N6-L-threonylcarbamoyladenine synthase
VGALKKILGIESTAHTIGIGIAISKAPYIVANEKSTYVPEKGAVS